MDLTGLLPGAHSATFLTQPRLSCSELGGLDSSASVNNWENASRVDKPIWWRRFLVPRRVKLTGKEKEKTKIYLSRTLFIGTGPHPLERIWQLLGCNLQWPLCRKAVWLSFYVIRAGSKASASGAPSLTSAPSFTFSLPALTKNLGFAQHPRGRVSITASLMSESPGFQAGNMATQALRVVS